MATTQHGIELHGLFQVGSERARFLGFSRLVPLVLHYHFALVVQAHLVAVLADAHFNEVGFDGFCVGFIGFCEGEGTVAAARVEGTGLNAGLVEEDA